MRFVSALGFALVAGCGATNPAAEQTPYALEHVRGALVSSVSGDIPFVQVAGTDTNWIQDGRLVWDARRTRYSIVIRGVASHSGARQPWQIADSGSYESSSWQCNGCMPFRLLSDQHFNPEGEVRFIPDTPCNAATADVYNLAGDGYWVYTFRRQ